MKNQTLFLLACLLCLPRLGAQERLDARELLQAAHDVSGLTKLMPYKLHAVVIVNPGSAAEKKGEVTIYRDKERLRTELHIEDYRETKITLGNKLYVARSTPWPAPGLSRLAETDHIWDRLADDGDSKLSGVSHKKVQNVQAECFEVKGQQHHRLCFDPQKRVLLESLDQEKALEFSEYSAIESLLVPHKVTELLELPMKELPVLVMQDIEVQPSVFMPNVFAIPEHSQEFETCANMLPAKAQQTPRPDFGANVVRRNMAAERVNVYGIVEKDGSLQKIKVLSADADVQQAVLEALKKWRYSPAMCGTAPVATEQEIPIPFTDAAVPGQDSRAGRR